MTTKPTDPLGLMRDWLGQWETLVNQHGAEWLKRPEVAQAVGAATSAGARAQGAMQDVMERALAAANLPSKADIEALNARLTAIEASLAQLTLQQGPAPTVTPAARPAPRRTRKPTP